MAHDVTSRGHHRGGACMLALVVALGWVLSWGGTGRAADPPPGTVIGPDTAAQAEGLLPPEFLERYRKGEWKHPVGTLKPGTQLIDPEWVAAGKENAGKLTLNDEGSIREVATGEQPARIWGVPFPTIDPKDPKAGAKIVWNYFYQSYLAGDNEVLAGLVWVEQGGTGRALKTDVLQKYYDGQKPFRLPKENPLNLLFQQFVQVTFPADVQGTISLAWRYRDTRRDADWAYVPALRRTRQVSPSNRSDGSFGSDMSEDDGAYFDGKPEDFDWKLVGEADELVLLDKGTVVDGIEDLRPLPKGGWRAVYPSTPRFNFEKPGWTQGAGQAWAPVSENYVLVKRSMWVVEGTPKDRYYLYGKLILRFDKETWVGSYSSKYDWQGNVLNSYLPMHGAWFKKGDDYRPYMVAQFSLSQNFKLDRATVAIAEQNDPAAAFDSLIELPAERFDVDGLARSGR